MIPGSVGTAIGGSLCPASSRLPTVGPILGHPLFAFLLFQCLPQEYVVADSSLIFKVNVYHDFIIEPKGMHLALLLSR